MSFTDTIQHDLIKVTQTVYYLLKFAVKDSKTEQKKEKPH